MSDDVQRINDILQIFIPLKNSIEKALQLLFERMETSLHSRYSHLMFFQLIENLFRL